MTAIMVSFSFALIGPAYTFFEHGIKSTIIEVHMPFCAPKSNVEFIGNLLIQSIFATHALLIYVALEIHYSLFQNTVTIAPKLIKNQLDTVIQSYRDKSISETELYWTVKQIAKKSIDMDK